MKSENSVREPKTVRLEPEEPKVPEKKSNGTNGKADL